jgi:thioredoxin-dependent peroxiredoxin
MLKENDTAPDFALPDQDGNEVSLSGLRGRRVVLYFYPKDDTPGCTTQACELRDSSTTFDARGTVILGVSPDSPGKHRKFREKYDLPFTLLADEDHAVAEAYGVWAQKSFLGKKYWGNERTTFVIGADGRIVKVLPNVKPAEHVDQVLGVLQS